MVAMLIVKTLVIVNMHVLTMVGQWVISAFVLGLVGHNTQAAVQRPQPRDPQAYVVEGDVNIGQLARITDSTCSGPVRNSTLISTEVVSFAVKDINNDPNLLPNITLGFVIVDSCSSALEALAASVYFLKEDDHLEDPASMVHPSNLSVARHYDVVGVVGIVYSSYAVNVAALLGAFHIPLVSHYATSDELSDKARFPYFMRMVSPDKHSAEVLVNMAAMFNWTYASLVYSEGTFGEHGAKQIEKQIKHTENIHICLAFNYRIASDADDAEYAWVAEQLVKHNKARIVFLIGESGQQRALYKALETSGQRHAFVFLTGDLFTPYEGVNEGGISLDHITAVIPGVSEYIREMTPWNNPANPWLPKLWQDSYECLWNVSHHENSSCYRYRMPESLWTRYMRPTSMSRLYDAVYVYGYALHNLIGEFCPEQFFHVNRSELRQCVSGERLISHMKRVDFQGITGHVAFDERGDLLEDLMIEIYDESLRSAATVYSQVGRWNSREKQITFNLSAVDWSVFQEDTMTKSSNDIPESICSQPCSPRQYFILQELPCCWECYFCRNNERIVDNGTACEPCPMTLWPDADTATQCEPITPTYLIWSDPISVGLVTLSVVGILLTIFVGYFVYRRRHHRLIRVTSKELAVILLLGTLIASISVMLFLAKPTRASCVMRMLGFHYGVNFLYSPLVVKTTRIYRIFTAGKRSVKQPRWVSSVAQLVLTFAIIAAQTLVLLVCELVSPTRPVLTMKVRTEPYVELRCEQELWSFLTPLSVNLLLILVCASLGYMARKLPENFNESWYIFISVSTTLFMWLVFLPTYYSAFYAHQQMALLAFCLNLNAFISVCCLFLPKVYAIIFLNEDQIKFSTVASTTVSAIQVQSVSAVTRDKDGGAAVTRDKEVGSGGDA